MINNNLTRIDQWDEEDRCAAKWLYRKTTQNTPIFSSYKMKMVRERLTNKCLRGCHLGKEFWYVGGDEDRGGTLKGTLMEEFENLK